MRHLIAIIIPLLISCERFRPEQKQTEQTRSIKLLLFAGGYCQPCKEELPEIQGWYDAHTDRKRITPLIYFIAGNPATKPANQDDANTFKGSLGVSFDIFADKFAKYYKTFYKTGTIIPATVILNDRDEVIKTYNPGKISINVLNADIKEILE